MNGTQFAGLQPAPAWTRTDLLLVVLLSLLGAGLRLPGLNEGLWADEITTLLDYVLVPPEAVLSNYDSRNNHIFYSLLAQFSVWQFGVSAWALRLPAVLFGICTIPAAYYLGRQLASRAEAIVASAFLAFSYHHVWFSQNARGYSGLLLGGVLSSIWFVRLLYGQTSGRGTVLGYALIAAFTCWIHLAGAMVIVAHAALFLALAIPLPGRHTRDFRPELLAGLVLAGAFTVLLYLPALKQIVLEFLVVRAEASGPSEWQSWAWTVAELRSGAARAVPGGWPLAVAGCLMLALGIGAYVKQGLVPAAILVLPVVITLLVIAQLTTIFFPRFLLGSLVFLLLLGVRGGFAACRMVLPGGSDRAALAAGLVVALSTAIMVPAAWQPKQDFVAAAEFVRRERSAGDAVACSAAVAKPLQDYLGLDCQETRHLSELLALEQSHSRTWFIYTLPDLIESLSPQLWARVRDDYAVVKAFDGTVHEGSIVILVKVRACSPQSFRR